MESVTNKTIHDVENMSGHVELIAGRVVIEDKTTITHNKTVAAIATAIRNYVADNNGECTVFTENVALYCNELSEDNRFFFLPDVMAVCDEHGVREDGVHSAPLFVAEITSDSTKKDDYGDKMLMYRNIGVKEYWVVDIQRKMITKYLSWNQFVPEYFLHPDKLEVSVYPGLEIDLTEFMRV